MQGQAPRARVGLAGQAPRGDPCPSAQWEEPSCPIPWLPPPAFLLPPPPARPAPGPAWPAGGSIAATSETAQELLGLAASRFQK